MLQQLRAQFISHRDHLTGRGGVQTCTNEYLRTLSDAGIDVDVVAISHDMSLPTRVLRQFNSSPYFGSVRHHDLGRIRAGLEEKRYDIMFFNQVALAGAADLLTKTEPYRTTKIALSHGCEITDMLHAARLKSTLPISARLRPNPAIALGSTLADEWTARRALDGVVALSPFDAETERWLGMSHVTWVPRTLAANPVEWTPQDGVFGYLGTLDHAPNLEGLTRVLEAAGPNASFRLQVVGGTPRIGAWLARRYSAVEYLGQLDDADVRRIAANWLGFVHPIFCQARGCSTKLATALDWGIPVVTTELGRRGYTWSSGECLEADSPATFVEAMMSLHDVSRAQQARTNVVAAAQSGPTRKDIASALRAFVDATRGSAMLNKVHAAKPGVSQQGSEHKADDYRSRTGAERS
jgi:hypothetical protein